MPKIFIIASLTAALSFGLLALVPAEQNSSNAMPAPTKSNAVQINL